MTTVETNEIFVWKEISIYQNDSVFKVGTDALLLGGWVPKIISEPKLILDAGTGTGILALMMAYSYPNSKITGVDIEQDALQLANYNFKKSAWGNRLEARFENILETGAGDPFKHDLILCNPPYFFNQLAAYKLSKATSKHTLGNSVAWFKAFSSRLNARGHLCLVLPYEIAFEWIKAANEIGLYCQHRLEVFSFQDDPEPVRCLIHFHEGLCTPEITRMNIYEKIGSFSDEYFRFSGIQH